MAKKDAALVKGASGGLPVNQAALTTANASVLTAADAATVDVTYGSEEQGVIINNRTRVAELETIVLNLRTRLNELEAALQRLGHLPES